MQWMARYEAEERIKARDRKAETQIKSGNDGRIMPDEVTAHVQGPQGESAAIIAEKASVSATCNLQESISLFGHLLNRPLFRFCLTDYSGYYGMNYRQLPAIE